MYKRQILISSHILSELADMCTGIGIINKGKMVLQGDIEEILLSIDSSNPILITVYKNCLLYTSRCV